MTIPTLATPAGATVKPGTWGAWKLFVIGHGANTCYSRVQAPIAVTLTNHGTNRVAARAGLQVKCKKAISSITGSGTMYRDTASDTVIGTKQFGLGNHKSVARVPDSYYTTVVTYVTCVASRSTATTRDYHAVFKWWPGSSSSGAGTSPRGGESSLTTNCEDG
jgi:hypothetical protein